MDGFYDLLDDIDVLFKRQFEKSLFESFNWSTKVSEIESIIL